MTDDGTQDPGPPPVLSDPVSGLVTGSEYEPAPLKVRVVQPPMPDLSAVREAMAGMLDEDSDLSLGLAAHSAATTAAADETSQVETQVETQAEESAAPAAEAPTSEPHTPPIGIPAQQAAESAETPREQPRAPVTAKVVTPPGTVEPTSRVPRRFLPMPRSEKPAAAVGRKSSAPSVAAIMVLLLVIGVLVIVFIASLLDSLASIFG